jgi:hypothetical protein
MKPTPLQFMIDEIVQEGPQMICKLAQHRFGCRVIEGLLTRCTSDQLFKVLPSLLADATNLCMHRHGNFVMQRLLEHRYWRPAVLSALEANASEVGCSFFGSLVLGHALRQEPQEDQAQLANTIATLPKLLQELKRFRHGSAVVELVFQIVDQP